MHKKAKNGKSILIKIAPPKFEFVLVDGRKLKDVRELAFALADMADDVFWHHASDAKNDFSNWINDVLKDKELADALKLVKGKLNTQLAILKHLVKHI